MELNFLISILDRDRADGADTTAAVAVSALTGKGLDELALTLQSIVRRGKRTVTYVIPNAEQGALSRLYSAECSVESVDYGPEAVTVVATVDERVYGLMKKYLKED